MEEKAHLRETVLAARDALPPETRAAKSAAICAEVERLVEHGAAAAGAGADEAGAARGAGERALRRGRKLRLAVYAPMRSEVDVMPLVEAAYARGWEVCFPCMVRDGDEYGGSGGVRDGDERGASDGGSAAAGRNRMAFYAVPRAQLPHARKAFLDHPLRCLPCAALDAAGYRPVEPEQLDAVAVPLVAFDDKGNRLGYGGGNYDRLLPRLRPVALVVGVAFAEQRVSAVPCEPHDQPLPHIAHA